MTISVTKMNASQFLAIGEDPPGLRLELVHGEISVSPSPAYEHSYTDTQLTIILGNHIFEHDLGELVGDVDTLFNNSNVRRPDIIFTAKSRLHLLAEKEHAIPYAPDLCVEILSPASATMDQTDKWDLYAQSGVMHYWLIDPLNRTFNAYKLTRKRYVKVASGIHAEVVTAAPFPKLKIPLNRIWPPLRKR